MNIIFSLVSILAVAFGILWLSGMVTMDSLTKSNIENISNDSDFSKLVSDPIEAAKEVKEKLTITSGETIDLSNQNLTETPESIFTQTEARTLNLSNNKLSGSLPGEIRFLKNLMVLNLSNNDFTGVPAEIGQLSNLAELDLSNNNLTGLPYELGNLSNLKVLNISGNAYSEADLAIIVAKLPDSVNIITD